MPANSTYENGVKTVSATATLICEPDCGTGGIYLTNTGSNPVFLGGSAVTATTAPQLAAGASIIFPTSAGPTSLYGICGTGLSTTVTWAFSPV